MEPLLRPLISICIPAYKNVAFLRRLLDSISIQTFKEFEVIITDDSMDDEVQQIANAYTTKFSLHYYRNRPPFGMPGNWNAGIREARGEWIKIMHDDDWFASEDALQLFANATGQNNKFIFSFYNNIYLGSNTEEKISFPRSQCSRLLSQPLLLMANNIIGPPSVCMIHKNVNILYDVRLRWRVDIDYYASILRKERKMTTIPQYIINVGINAEQVTNSTKNRPEVELPEAFVLLKKYGTEPLSNIYVYDAWWRMFRNMNILSEKDLSRYIDENPGDMVRKMLHDLSKVPIAFLKMGILSKLFMGISYLTNKHRNTK